MTGQRKRAFVTGGSHGIGRGIIRVLAENGYDVAFTYNRREDEAVELQKEITAKNVKCYYYQASLEKIGVAEEITQKAIDDLGGIDLMVCNAGATKLNDLLNLEHEQIDFLFNLNYRSYLMCAKVAANSMVDSKVKGNIIFVTSTRGERAYVNDALYGGFKAGINRAAASMALEMAQYGVRVNCVAPGATFIGDEYTEDMLTKPYTATKVPLKRLGTPKEVGELIHYITNAGYMTGNVIKLDGGLILYGPNENPNATIYK